MNTIGSLLRIVCGLGLVILSWSNYQKVNHPLAPGERLQILGMTVGASPGQLTVALGVTGLIGLGLIALGVLGMLKGRD